MKKYTIIILIIGGIIAILSVPKTYDIENKSQEPEAKIEKSRGRIITAKITQYTLLGTMASGKQVYDGAIACPRAIKLGTRVEIDGIEYVCEDRMAKRYDCSFGNNCIEERWDIWTSEYNDAIQWGKKIKTIEIYD